MFIALKRDIMAWWDDWQAFRRLATLVILCLTAGVMVGYCLGRHVGYVADLEDEEPAPYHSLMKGRK